MNIYSINSFWHGHEREWVVIAESEELALKEVEYALYQKRSIKLLGTAIEESKQGVIMHYDSDEIDGG